MSRNGFLGGLRRYFFGYDAVENSNKRRPPKTVTYSEDDELPGWKRRRLVATAREIVRNYPLAAWAIRCHLCYIASYQFQCTDDDQQFARRLEDLMAWWQRPENCDITGRHSFSDMIRIAESCRVVDGDVLWVMLDSGHIQAIEGDRIRTPGGNDTADVIGGVRIDQTGRPIQYAVHRRDGAGLTLDRWVDARNAILLGYFDRYDQTRGVSRLASAINTLQDMYEITNYAVAKAKVAQLFGLVTYREAGDSPGIVSAEDVGSGERYNIEFGRGPFHLDLDPGDRVEVVESGTPPAELQNFYRLLTMQVLKSLDIPFSFYDEAHTNYSGARQALLQYQYSAAQKREQWLCALDAITKWKIAQWVGSGLLKLPRDVGHIWDVKWEWVPTGLPWIDPLRETEADIAAIDAGLKSRQQVARERGRDFFQIADQLLKEKQYMEDIGLRKEE